MDAVMEKILRNSETNAKMITTLADQLINLVNHCDTQHQKVLILETKVKELEQTVRDMLN
jgi:hypothetical protein